MMPPNMLGRGALMGDGVGRAERSGRCRGDAGLTAPAGAGGEYEREPRLPPLPARAHASPAAPASVSSDQQHDQGRETCVIGIPRPLME